METNRILRKGSQLLMRDVADGHDQIRSLRDLLDRLGARSTKVEASPSGRLDRLATDPFDRPGPCARGWHFVPCVPDSRGHLRPSGVRRAHEQDVASEELGNGPGDLRNGVRNQAHVPSSAIARGREALDHARMREHVEVVGQQVRGDGERLRKLGGRPIGYDQLVDDLKPVRIPQRAVDLSPLRERSLRIH